MHYLSSHIIYNEVIDGMRAMCISKEELAHNLEMITDELELLLTPTRDYTISEIIYLLGGVYMDIRVEIVPAWRCSQICLFLHINVNINSMEKKEYRNRIRVILAEKMITNTYLAEQLGVSKMTISRWCTNTTQPSAPQLIEISRILQCDLKELYETIK